MATRITLTEFLDGTSRKTCAVLLDHMRVYGTSSVETYQNGPSKVLILTRDHDITVEIHTLMNVDVSKRATPEQIAKALGV